MKTFRVEETITVRLAIIFFFFNEKKWQLAPVLLARKKKTHKLVSSNANYHSKVYGKEIKMEYATNKEELSYSNIYHFEKREYKKNIVC